MFKGETVESGANNGMYGTNGVSELQVLDSHAGWYLGTMYWEEEGYWVPNTRETHYFSTQQEAEDALDEWLNGNKIGMRT